MTSHDLDPRYREPDVAARVAVLYLPLLGIVMDSIPQLHHYLSEIQDRLHSIGLLEDYQGPLSKNISIKKLKKLLINNLKQA